VDSHGKVPAFKPPARRPADAIPVEHHTLLCYTSALAGPARPSSSRSRSTQAHNTVLSLF
jgi:hypothetical protein